MAWLELLLVLALILLNGVLALSELAIVSSRRSRLRAMAEAGDGGAATALDLAADPGRFLSTVQTGITLIGILAGAYSGRAFGDRLAAVLTEAGVPAWIAEPMAIGLVVVLITYLSLVIGELVPKQLALRNAEAVAARVAPAMRVLSRVATPAAWFLDVSSNLVLRVFGSEERTNPAVTEDEIRMLIAEAETAGVIEPEERRMIAGVLRLGDRPVRALMTPRADVDWIDLQDTPESICAKVLGSGHSRLPAGEGSVDSLIGVIRARDLLAALASAAPGEPAATPRAAAARAAGSLDFRAMVRPAPIVPDTADAMDVLGRLREAPTPMALIHDEYGHFEGIVTPADLMEAIAGAFHREEEAEEPDAVEREDGSWLLSGAMPADDMADRLGLRLSERRDYHTVAGFVLAQMRRLPQVGESFDAMGWRFEVVDLDRGRRIDKVLAQRLPVLARPRR